MPAALIAILVLGALGAGAYFFTNSSTPEAVVREPETTEIARTDIETPNNDPVEEVTMRGADDDDGDSVPTADIEMSADAAIDTEVTTDASADMIGSSIPDDETAAATEYSSEQTYLTPARTSHEIDVNLSIASDGTIVGANVSYDNGDGFSNGHQERFDSAYQAEIIGQNISDAELAVTGGASLTTEAFNAALAEVRTERS